MRRQAILCAALAFGLFGATAAFADSDTVPVDSLKPAVPLEKPQLFASGGKLIFSDSPETISGVGALYRDRAEGEFRVFWHHQNTSSRTYSVGVAVTNTSNRPVKLMLEGNGIGTNIYVDVAGQSALVDFLNSQKQKTWVATLEPGQTYYASKPTDPGITSSGIVQFEALTRWGNLPAQVTVTTLSYDKAPEHPEQLPVLPEDSHVRGTFPHFDRLGLIKYDTALGNAYLRVDNAAYGQWKDDMPGEYEEGWDAVDGKSVINNGNYGVMYHFAVLVKNSQHDRRTGSLYLNPSGGYGHYAMLWNKELYQTGFISYQNAWHIADYKVNPFGGLFTSEMSLTGGSSGPQTIYFTTQPK